MAKANVKTALQSRSNLRFNNYHTTTSDFFQFDVAYSREMVPEQNLRLKLLTQARLAGMPLPSFADVELHRRAFFVPFRVVWRHWNAFITQQPTAFDDWYGIPDKAPYFTLEDIFNLFLQPAFTEQEATQESDVIIGYKNPSNVYTEGGYTFTDLGRHTYKLLTQLGYSFQFVQPTKKLSELGNYRYNALPILCLAKVYSDWFIPSQYRGTDTDINELTTILEDLASSVPSQVSYRSLTLIFTILQTTFYGHDYFTDAFDRPTGNDLLNPTISVSDSSFLPASGNVPKVSTDSFTSGGSDSVINYEGSPTLRTSVSSKALSQISQFGLNALAKLTAFMKRRQIAGSRVLENYLAEFGIKLPSVNLNMSVYLNGDSVPVIIRDVTSTSQTLNAAGTEGSNLGDYAGQGRIYPDSALHVDCDSNGEYGMLLVVTSLIPRVGYVQGLRRHCLHVAPLDFYHGDFDGLGNREIRLDELATPDPSNNIVGSGTHSVTQDEVFGFTPQYSEYKVQHDSLTGDFRIFRLNQAGFTSDAWHLNRMFMPDGNGDITIPSHSLDFLKPRDKNQYSRIFYSLESDESSGKKVNADHFVLNHIQMCETSAPFKPLYEDYTLDHIDGNRDVSIDVNGNYMD